jgi:hypothetical protein
MRHFLLLSQLAYPLLQPRGGRSVAISRADTVGYIPGHGLLAAAKAGMETIVEYLAVALVCLLEARWLNGRIVRNDGAGLFAYTAYMAHMAHMGYMGYMGRFGET